MGIDALLAIVHHLSGFALVGLLFVEVAIVRGRMDGPAIGRLGRVDALYGIVFTVVVLAGIGRLAWGIVPGETYLANAFFWLKMAALGGAALVSITPTVRGGRWRRASAGNPGFEAPAGELRLVRRALWLELAILPVVPIAAALMARGYGAF
jgi:putative membrane protein